MSDYSESSRSESRDNSKPWYDKGGVLAWVIIICVCLSISSCTLHQIYVEWIK